MIIVLNKNSNAGNGVNKWQKVKSLLDQKKIEYQLIASHSFEESMSELDKLLKENPSSTVIAAGGDGTVNGIINHLIDPSTNTLKYPIKFGAIGLGSSNDFHKPLNSKRMIENIPVILPFGEFSLNEEWDLGKADYINKEEKNEFRFFSINSGLGLTALGNAYFNRPSQWLGFLKKIHVELANVWTMGHLLKKIQYTKVRFLEENQEFNFCNMGILKKRNISGGMKYDTEVEKDDGFLDIVMSKEMNRKEVINLIINLYKGKFLGMNKTQYWKKSEASFDFDSPIPIEFDGEVFWGNKLKYSVANKVLKIC